ncbi:transcriptional regulator [Liquorilactobacillus sucicola DSM 21376 = JCM 15457]|uniref:HTH lysR-type domain-containing protein n=1 Tax=Liquorilactobacillus sucicola DSM 21376 = JCM 15457 TaxID=1423806 RepID=A0A023CVT4_9LACO|nr:LysR family transcriptional regulator [Liquorilactobacillus sucicola]KRN05563.1 hypothetical protein FD15_GL002125 [Liquorilactobacillus sucicola DSM 21376 = JCM 15457]GAJ25645.1 transcriptional regulator [Liquorilactobacillus sucicola DSM 21376 = JCM 15457]
MDINELVTFKTVVEKKSFSAAADFLGYSQPNVTKHIKKIEEAVGFELFKRGWKATLTREGELFYKAAADLIDHWKSVCLVSQEIETEQVGELRIGIIEPLAKKLLPNIINWMEMYKPKMDVTFEMGNTRRLAELVATDELDCAFCGETDTFSQELEFKKICKDEIRIIVLKGHELLTQKEVALNDILKYPLIYGDKTCLSHQAFMQVLQQQNLLNQLKTHYICSNQLLIPDILTSNQVGITTQSLAAAEKGKTVPLAIKDMNVKLSYGIIKKKRNYNYLEKTIQSITELALQAN